MGRRDRVRWVVAAAVLATVAHGLGSGPASAQGFYYKEIVKDGRIYVFNMTLWAEAFRQYYPNVKIQVEGKGSSTAPPSLIAGTSQFGPMSREMRAISSRRSTATSRPN